MIICELNFDYRQISQLEMSPSLNVSCEINKEEVYPSFLFILYKLQVMIFFSFFFKCSKLKLKFIYNMVCSREVI